MIKNIKPIIVTLSETKAQKIALLATTDATYKNIQDIKYEDLINIYKDKDDKIPSISTNVVEISRLSTKISSDIYENVNNQTGNEISVPIGSLISQNIFSNQGPSFKVKVLPTSNNKVEFMSEFDSIGVNQTKHRIYLRTTTSVKIITPFLTFSQEYVNDIVIAETIIVGDVPSTYYDLSGMGNLDIKDSLNLTE